MSPGGSHWFCSVHVPALPPAGMEHVVVKPPGLSDGFGGEPQHWLFAVQTSYAGLHPDGGWQMWMLVVPHGPHAFEQHFTSQPEPVQSVPAGWHPPALETSAHVP